jgi:small subunit ribosomal protein S15
VDEDAIESRVVELAEEGHDPSAIGRILRDEGIDGTPIPDVKLATGNKIGDILAEHDAEPDVPEDLRNLLERAIRLSEHMEEHPNDVSNKRARQNTESKARRLIEYYRGDELPADFSYSVDNARELLGEY